METEELRKLVSARVVPIIGDINSQLARKIKDQIARLVLSGSPDIVIAISSNGGGVEQGLNIYDLIDTYPGRRTGIVLDRANSMASVILQACDERILTRNGTILIHDIRCMLSLSTARHPDKFAKWLADAEKTNDRIIRILAGRSGGATNAIRTLCEEDRSLDFEEARKWDLVDCALSREKMTELFPHGHKVTKKPVNE